MKKSLFTLLGGMFTFGVMAQGYLQPPNKIEVKEYQVPNHSKLRVNAPASAGGQISQWFSYAGLQENQNGFTGGSMMLFPDSSVVIAYLNSGTPAMYNNLWISAGQALDVKDVEFSFDPNTEPLSKFNDYSVDSISILYLYDRKIHTVTDTMIVSFHKQGSTPGAMSLWAFGTPPNQNVFASTDFNRSTREATKGATVYQIRIPLTALDSIANQGVWGVKTIAIPTSFKGITRNNIIGTTVSFKPGYTYAAGDTILTGTGVNEPVNPLNAFWVRTLNNGNNSVYAYYNNGMLIDKTQLYTDRLQNFGSRYLPSNFYTVSQIVHIDYLISSANVGIKDINTNGYGLGNAYPNPVSVNSSVNIPFVIGKSGDVTLTITNIIGQNVSVNTGKFNTGENTFTVDLNNLKPGVYFYTISSGNFTSTKKFTVAE
jgi:hypothetical protein